MKFQHSILFRPFIYFLFAAFIVLANLNLHAQTVRSSDLHKNDIKSRLFYGGGFGLQFGNITLIEVSPLIGYKVTPKFSVGAGPSYKYYRYKNYYINGNQLQTNVIGGSIFARYTIYENIFAHTEYESLFYHTKAPGAVPERKQYNSLFVGGGYQQNIGENSGMYILVLWNLNDTPDSPYSNPVIRVGFNIGM